MNKKEAVAYAQVTLNYMQSSKYTGEVNPDTLGIEMNQAFKIYPKDIIINIAESQFWARKKLKETMKRSDILG